MLVADDLEERRLGAIRPSRRTNAVGERAFGRETVEVRMVERPGTVAARCLIERRRPCERRRELLASEVGKRRFELVLVGNVLVEGGSLHA